MKNDKTESISIAKEPVEENEDQMHAKIMKLHYEEQLENAADEKNKLKTEISTLKVSISEIGKERDFYYSKLRDIEMLTVKHNTLDRDGLISIIKNILTSETEIEVITDENGKTSLKHF